MDVWASSGFLPPKARAVSVPEHLGLGNKPFFRIQLGVDSGVIASAEMELYRPEPDSFLRHPDNHMSAHCSPLGPTNCALRLSRPGWWALLGAPASPPGSSVPLPAVSSHVPSGGKLVPPGTRFLWVTVSFPLLGLQFSRLTPPHCCFLCANISSLCVTCFCTLCVTL